MVVVRDVFIALKKSFKTTAMVKTLLRLGLRLSVRPKYYSSITRVLLGSNYSLTVVLLGNGQILAQIYQGSFCSHRGANLIFWFLNDILRYSSHFSVLSFSNSLRRILSDSRAPREQKGLHLPSTCRPRGSLVFPWRQGASSEAICGGSIIVIASIHK